MRLILAGAALLAVSAAACRPAALKDEDQAAMRAAADSFNAYFRADRDSATVNLFAENAVFLPPNTGPVEGRPAIRAFFEGLPAIPDFTHTVLEIDGRDDLAYVRGTYSYTMPATGRNPAVQDHGKFVEIRRRQADGRWLVTIDIFNSDVPVPTR
jgi:uncharacterized protein (TIGR02246 family)